MANAYLDRDFWIDEKIIDEYSVEDKYFMLYILTCPKGNALGIYKSPIRLMAFELGYSSEAVKVLIERFDSKYNRIIYNQETQEIAVLNALKYNIQSGGSPIADMIKRQLREVTDIALIEAVYNNMHDFWSFSDRKIDKSIKELFEDEIERRKTYINNTNTYTDTYTYTYTVTPSDTLGDTVSDTPSVTVHDTQKEKSNKEESDEDKKIPYKDIIDYLNDKADRQYRASTNKTKDLIKARYNDGFNLDDFKTVIDNKVKDWTGTEYEKFIRPETLFGNKFEGYLNEQYIRHVSNKTQNQWNYTSGIDDDDTDALFEEFERISSS